ncbi:2-keto-4-pentenoate hydratase/2-oxohepta-3-ene-1,7-dioic acid hydratase in catechol pathway [Sphingobacterium allocomposti]|jgi:2,4-diketo-3-deoxy-L-fuconate hydrolase|uniref:2-keto-4-pentenoate hydratase/2-oxohepta-3-ene-1,7-dioic acid hydratase in catechol pathway n=1 Tax=Sphingobacterium allocomposti TaxID=415956 RepID=A0A5S5DN91_9SPHI|nr:fumarylacetoacetate hydrolase family protein [Sphingobacterium composti Yoo et al. 2007 non Ten et al. 2007]TYP96848.1 2-keto-4-pentenoate hydratase/2-oxohepta-3-ene-1,7-dioic acid hydratase in catechol pathway [Sphingobacterium composti Yoo et al. 2007 non Ten et al. 2007]HLS96517.1 fumarylacetoacetate hydrolase family protein [Sphingobacterium sp.]
MKLIRFGEYGKEKIGVQIDGVNYDVSAFGGDYNEQFFAENGLARLEEFVKANQGKLIEVPQGTRLGAPFARPSKIVCIGLNYKDHAEETGAKIPAEPIIFMKSTTSLVGPYDQIVIPKNSVKTDWEVEFGIVVGKRASYVEESDALDYVAGYVLHNDVSERAYQLERGGTWDKGKGCDTFAPMGPYLTTTDEIPDINNVRLWLKVNGKTYQDGNTSNLIFSVAHVVSYVSQFMTLLPGDVISTGTPAGVGLGFNPPIYLKPGDVVELGADYLGESRQEVVAFGQN